MVSAKVVFQPEGKRLVIDSGKTILEAAKKIGIDILSICGGRGVCGKDRVIIRSGGERLSPLSNIEKKLFSQDEIRKGFRLACQAVIKDGSTIVVEVPLQSRIGYQRLLLKGMERKVELKPSVKKVTLHLLRPSLIDVKSDVDRLMDAVEDLIGFRPRIDYEALKEVPFSVRKGGWKVTAVVWMNRELISVKPEGDAKGVYGLAVDIGTTKVAAYLLNLETGEIVETVAMMNPQIPYGEDVISRISYTMKRESNLENLHNVIVEGINELIEEACEKAGIESEDICDMTIVGNTAMHHIFLNIPPKYVALMPYPPALQSSVDIKAREVGVKINRGAYVHALPTIAGFVGADAVADALATEVYKSDVLSMVIDIGTNTEIILGDKNRLIACSCASGPAFEGAHIKHGMRAATGAIEHLWINPKTLEVGYKTIGDVKPRGICGSGIVDAVAEMLRTGLISLDGKFDLQLETPRIRVERNLPEFVIAWKDETLTGNDITLTQKDVREVQLAKAAIYTGTFILMKHMGVSPSDIQRIFIAGAFGNYIDPQSAKTIGMFPDVPLHRVQFAGNTAGSGARMTLLSTEMRRLAIEVAGRIEYLELGADPEFNVEFLKATYFPHKEVGRFPDVMRLLKRKD